MKHAKVSIKTVIIVCIIMVVLLSIVSNMMAQSEYQNFYKGFSAKYSLLMKLIDLKNDIHTMYTDAASYMTNDSKNWPGIHSNYEMTCQHAKSTLDELTAQTENPEKYLIVDVGNMLTTFDESYRKYHESVLSEYSLYLTTDLRYLYRLDTYIADEISAASEVFTVSAQEAYNSFLDRLERMRLRGIAAVAVSAVFSLIIAMWMARKIADPLHQLMDRMSRFAQH